MTSSQQSADITPGKTFDLRGISRTFPSTDWRNGLGGEPLSQVEQLCAAGPGGEWQAQTAHLSVAREWLSKLSTLATEIKEDIDKIEADARTAVTQIANTIEHCWPPWTGSPSTGIGSLGFSSSLSEGATDSVDSQQQSEPQMCDIGRPELVTLERLLRMALPRKLSLEESSLKWADIASGCQVTRAPVDEVVWWSDALHGLLRPRSCGDEALGASGARMRASGSPSASVTQ